MQSATRLILSMLKHYLFWLLLFAFSRLVFILWNREELADASIGHILFAFVKGLYVDTAMASYLLTIPYLFIVTTALTAKQKVMKVSNYVHGILFFAFFMLIFSELSIYDEWHTKLNYKALWFFGNPSEVLHTASWTQTILVCSFSIIGTVVCMWLYRKFFTEEFHEAKRSRRFVVSVLIVPLLLFIGIRGGFQTIPVQLSDAYYSQHNVLNLASVNSMFNLSSSVIENSKGKEPYDFMPEMEAQKYFTELYTQPHDTMTQILNNKRPNIVLIVLEGWSADMLESFSGFSEPNIAPHLDSIARAGIRFPRCYATGSLSDQGMAAVFSGFPAQPLTSIITQPDKYAKLPCINKKLKAEGYYTTFMFGGQLSYGNIRSYMYFNGFDKITEQEHFPSDIPMGKLGAHDEFLFAHQLEELKNVQQPFFAAMFTLSTHGPYDFPSNTDLNFGDKEEDYVNSVHYADSCIGDFMRKAKKEPWFNNTLFVFVSDHSHNSPNNFPFNSPGYRRIPMIMYGNVIDSSMIGAVVNPIVSQVDLAAILLGQMGIDHSEFKYSQNVFAFPKKVGYRETNFAYYAFEEGFGFIENHSSVVWSVDGRFEYTYVNLDPNIEHLGDSDSLTLMRKGQAIMQTISTDYSQY